MTLTLLMWILFFLCMLCLGVGFWSGYRKGNAEGIDLGHKQCNDLWIVEMRKFKKDADTEYTKAFAEGGKGWRDKYYELVETHTNYVLEHGGE